MIRQNYGHIKAIAGWLDMPEDNIENVIASVGRTTIDGRDDRIRLGLVSFFWHIYSLNGNIFSEEEVVNLVRSIESHLYSSDKIRWAHRKFIEENVSPEPVLKEMGYEKNFEPKKEALSPTPVGSVVSEKLKNDIEVPEKVKEGLQELLKAGMDRTLVLNALTYDRTGQSWSEEECRGVCLLYTKKIPVEKIAAATGRSILALGFKLFE